MRIDQWPPLRRLLILAGAKRDGDSVPVSQLKAGQLILFAVCAGASIGIVSWLLRLL